MNKGAASYVMIMHTEREEKFNKKGSMVKASCQIKNVGLAL
jgi:hypothetical protein